MDNPEAIKKIWHSTLAEAEVECNESVVLAEIIKLWDTFHFAQMSTDMLIQVLKERATSLPLPFEDEYIGVEVKASVPYAMRERFADVYDKISKALMIIVNERRG